MASSAAAAARKGTGAGGSTASFMALKFSPAALRADLGSQRNAPAYLFSASELLDRAADLLAESATLVRDNERRWRVFGARVRRLPSD